MGNVELFNQAVLKLANVDKNLLGRVKEIKSLIDKVDPSKLPAGSELNFKNLKADLDDPHDANAYQIATVTVGLFSAIRADSVLNPARYQ